MFSRSNRTIEDFIKSFDKVYGNRCQDVIRKKRGNFLLMFIVFIVFCFINLQFTNKQKSAH